MTEWKPIRSWFRSDSFSVVFRSPIDNERSAISFLTPLALPSATLLPCRPPFIQPSPPLKQGQRFPHPNRDTGHESGFRYQLNRWDIYPRFILQNLVKLLKGTPTKSERVFDRKNVVERGGQEFLFLWELGEGKCVSHYQWIFGGRMAKCSLWFVCQLLQQRPLIRAWAKERKLTRQRGIKNSNNLSKR